MPASFFTFLTATANHCHHHYRRHSKPTCTTASTADAAVPLVIIMHLFISPRVVAVSRTALSLMDLVAVSGAVAGVAALLVFRWLSVVAITFSCC